MIINIEYNNKYFLSVLGFILGYLNFPFSHIIITSLITFYETTIIKELYKIDLYQFLLFYIFGIAFQNIFITYILFGFTIGIFLTAFINNNKKKEIAEYFKNNPQLILDIDFTKIYNNINNIYKKYFLEKNITNIIITFQNILTLFLKTFNKK
jgi:hypothetical protein